MPKDLIVEQEDKTPVTGSKKRRMILKDTVEKFSNDSLGDYEKQARKNHLSWADTKTNSEGFVRVIEGDWGDVTLELSKATGAIYAVLNMANAELPGGLYLQGCGTQEENMYRRTNCHFYVHDEEMDEKKDYYTQEMTNLINGVSGLVYLDVQNPRICIKAGERPNDSGYQDLAPSDYFLFYELKSAADNTSRINPFSEVSMRRKIAAQLDTLKKADVRFVVLSAFGCGAFGNPPAKVAKIYLEELQKRPGYFDEVVFAIYTSEYENENFLSFKAVLDGLPLKQQLSQVDRNRFLAQKQIKQEEENSDDLACKCNII